jgi:hypothetical protein
MSGWIAADALDQRYRRGDGQGHDKGYPKRDLGDEAIPNGVSPEEQLTTL